jgi:molybdate-binding protein
MIKPTLNDDNLRKIDLQLKHEVLSIGLYQDFLGFHDGFPDIARIHLYTQEGESKNP